MGRLAFRDYETGPLACTDDVSGSLPRQRTPESHRLSGLRFPTWPPRGSNAGLPGYEYAAVPAGNSSVGCFLALQPTVDWSRIHVLSTKSQPASTLFNFALCAKWGFYRSFVCWLKAAAWRVKSRMLMSTPVACQRLLAQSQRIACPLVIQRFDGAGIPWSFDAAESQFQSVGHGPESSLTL